MSIRRCWLKVLTHRLQTNRLGNSSTFKYIDFLSGTVKNVVTNYLQGVFALSKEQLSIDELSFQLLFSTSKMNHISKVHVCVSIDVGVPLNQ